MKRIFIAGPMSGYPQWNYQAFDDAAARIKSTHFGAKVLNPADNHARATNLPRWMYISKTLEQLRGLANVSFSGTDDCFVAVLDGWENSPGARLEAEAAHQMGLSIYQLECILDPHWDDRNCRIVPAVMAEFTYPACAICEEPHESIAEEDECEANRLHMATKPIANPDRVTVADPPLTTDVRGTVLDEAKRLILGDRNNAYGPPGKDFNRTANVLTSLGYGKEETGGGLGVIDDHDVAVIMIALKLSRIMWSPEKLDSWRDIAGYAGCGAEVAGATD